MSGHFGMPGPGGSMGMCAVCGDTFVVGVLKDLCGLPSGIIQFRVGFIDQQLYCHNARPDCKAALEAAFAAGVNAVDDDQRNELVRDALPNGPIKKALIDAMEEKMIDPIDETEAGSSVDIDDDVDDERWRGK